MAPVFMQNIHGKQIGLVTRCAPVSVRTAHPTLSSQQGVGRPAPLLLAKGCLARGSLERCRSLLVLQRPETKLAYSSNTIFMAQGVAGSLERCRSLLVLQRPETRFACYNIMYCLYGARCCRIPKRCRSFCCYKGLTETRCACYSIVTLWHKVLQNS